MRDRLHRLMHLAARQGGCFTTAQAKDLGYSHQGQKYHADRGNWLRLGRGLYRLTGWPRGEHDELHRWSLWARDEAVVSHRSALAVHRLPVPSGPTVELTVPAGFRARAQGVVLHRMGVRGGVPDLEDAGLEDAEVEALSGLRVTTIPRTVLDLAGELDPAELRALLEAAGERGALEPSDLLRRAELRGGEVAAAVARALGRPLPGAALAPSSCEDAVEEPATAVVAPPADDWRQW